jgi:hypothetical protein
MAYLFASQTEFAIHVLAMFFRTAVRLELEQNQLVALIE